MTTQPLAPVRSEKGVALVIVLLLLAVMMGLTTGMTMSSQTEIAMAANELNYAGARAAAEAGLNRAIEQIIANTATNLLASCRAAGLGVGAPGPHRRRTGPDARAGDGSRPHQARWDPRR